LALCTGIIGIDSIDVSHLEIKKRPVKSAFESWLYY
jgi:hypothetical protein